MFNKNNISDLMKQAQKMQEEMKKAQKEISNLTVTGESGAGLIKINLNGKYHCTNLKIDANLLKKEKKEMLEDLIIAAFNSANKKIHDEKQKKISILNPDLPFTKNTNLKK
ncbi:YbaB/EbfC family nucleoid-associated protein [Buchnera aphidicola]|uniref:YbaB/EbfC family nucleoid-associated protein n=1 Tax=Buchnera aphidicola TaxID=9 RepID=UPI0031B87D81